MGMDAYLWCLCELVCFYDGQGIGEVIGDFFASEPLIKRQLIDLEIVPEHSLLDDNVIAIRVHCLDFDLLKLTLSRVDDLNLDLVRQSRLHEHKLSCLHHEANSINQVQLDSLVSIRTYNHIIEEDLVVCRLVLAGDAELTCAKIW